MCNVLGYEQEALVEVIWAKLQNYPPLIGVISSFLTRGYAKRRNGFLWGLRYANVSLAHSGVESS